MASIYKPSLYWLVTGSLLLLWLAMAIRLRIPAYLLGQIPMFDFDAYHANLRDIVFNVAHPFSFSGMQTLGPPSVLISYLPFVFLPLSVARGLITFINLVCIFSSSFVLSRFLTFKYQALLAALMIVILTWAFPVRFSIEMGQTNLIVMLLASLMLTSSSFKGIYAGISVILKTNYLPLFISFLKAPHLLFQAFLTVVIIISLGFFWICPSYYLDYFQLKFFNVIADAGPPPNIDYYNQSFKATLSRFHLSPTYQPLAILLILFSAVYIGVTGSIPAAILFSIFISPVAWLHYLAVVYPIIFLHLFKNLHNWKIILYLGFIILLLSNHFSYIHTQPTTFVNSLVASHYFFGLVALTLFQVIYETRHRKRHQKLL